MIIEALGWALETTPWMDRAACAGSHLGFWFPTQGRNIEPARAVCATCFVRSDCLEYAVRWDIRFGVWGGLSERQRRHLKRSDPARVRAAHETVTKYARGCRCQGCRDANYAASLWHEDDNAAL